MGNCSENSDTRIERLHQCIILCKHSFRLQRDYGIVKHSITHSSSENHLVFANTQKPQPRSVLSTTMSTRKGRVRDKNRILSELVRSSFTVSDSVTSTLSLNLKSKIKDPPAEHQYPFQDRQRRHHHRSACRSARHPFLRGIC